MQTTSSEEQSENYALDVLRFLGCPDIRKAQGNPHFRTLNEPGANGRPYVRTPDLIAGPNNGSTSDFYIDVHHPTSTFLTREHSPLRPLGAQLETMIQNLETVPWGTRARVPITTLRPLYENEVRNPLRKKVKKYGHDRGSELVGLVGVFGEPSNHQDSRASINDSAVFTVYTDYLFADLKTTWVKVGHSDPEQFTTQLNEARLLLFEATGQLIRVAVPMNESMAFYLIVGQGHLGEYGLLITNTVIVENEKHRGHPVVEWLRNIAYLNHPVWLPE